MHYSEIPTLLRVARRVLIWLPLLYRVFRVSRFQGTSRIVFSQAMALKPAVFFHKCVRHLCLEDLRLADAVRILEVCTGVVDLALNRRVAHPDMLPILAEMSLRRLSADLDALFGAGSLFSGPIDLAHPSFTYVTHFDVLDFRDTDLILAQVPALPALTHLALDSVVQPHSVQALLEKCPCLELGLSLCTYEEQEYYQSAQTPHIYDVRFVMACRPRDYLADWEASAKGVPDLWSLGDEFVARKRRGEIEATCYWLPIIES
ncbi:hypothetical protein DFH06DRAFT_1233210 [Mycena polygramma]|nr:hypothetical protein DFH06DRAFT_1233210 [Mycena polygramma]